MDPFVIASASNPDWRTAAADCAAQLSIGDSSSNLGFLYVTDHLAPYFGDIAAYLKQVSGIDNWVGSVGIGVCSTGLEIFDQPGCVAMAAQIDADGFRVFGNPKADGPGLTAADIAWCERARPYFGVAHADPQNPRVSELVGELSDATGGAFLVGGLSSSRRECHQYANGVVHGGLSGVLFSDTTSVSTRLSQGCSPISGRHTVTKADRNLVIELDGKPALEALSAAAGELLMRTPRELGQRVFVGLPVAGVDTGDYMVRNLVGLDMQAGVFAVGATVEAGQSLMFCRRDAQSAHEDLSRMLKEILGSLSGPPRGGLYFSCLARGPNLFGPASAELRLLQRELGDVPLAGFFANGEISNNRIYAYTGVLTLFS